MSKDRYNPNDTPTNFDALLANPINGVVSIQLEQAEIPTGGVYQIITKYNDGFSLETSFEGPFTVNIPEGKYVDSDDILTEINEEIDIRFTIGHRPQIHYDERKGKVYFVSDIANDETFDIIFNTDFGEILGFGSGDHGAVLNPDDGRYYLWGTKAYHHFGGINRLWIALTHPAIPIDMYNSSTDTVIDGKIILQTIPVDWTKEVQSYDSRSITQAPAFIMEIPEGITINRIGIQVFAWLGEFTGWYIINLNSMETMFVFTIQYLEDI